MYLIFGRPILLYVQSVVKCVLGRHTWKDYHKQPSIRRNFIIRLRNLIRSSGLDNYGIFLKTTRTMKLALCR